MAIGLESIGALVEGGGGEGTGQALVNDDQTRAAADLPPAAAVEVADGVVIHEKQRVTLGREMGTTDFTDYTDFEYVMLPCPLTQEVSFLAAISNPILSVKSV